MESVTKTRNVPSASWPPSVNFHLWKPCNMRCRFCFATFEDIPPEVLPEGHLPREKAIRLVGVLARAFDKITFAGGEPTLCPWLVELIAVAKGEGCTTMLVTNASRLDELLDPLTGRLDWLVLSVDSASSETHAALGRRTVKGPVETGRYIELADRARKLGMRIKLNTVVTTLNADEDMTGLVRSIRPERWKILQALPIAGQNDGRIESLVPSGEAFAAFIRRNAGVAGEGVVLVPEDHDAIVGSYVMVDPAGRFFDDVTGRNRYSDRILEVGLEAAFSQIEWNADRFVARGGLYDWVRSPVALDHRDRNPGLWE